MRGRGFGEGGEEEVRKSGGRRVVGRALICTCGRRGIVDVAGRREIWRSAVVRASFVRQVLDGLPSSRCNALFFSTRGKRSVADELAGGDLDGASQQLAYATRLVD